MFRSLKNQTPLPGTTALVVDTSPSMWMARLSRNSDMDRFEAAAGLAILLRETAERVNVYAFNEKAYEVPPRRGFALRMHLPRPRTTGAAAASQSLPQTAMAMIASSLSRTVSGTSRTPLPYRATVRATRRRWRRHRSPSRRT